MKIEEFDNRLRELLINETSRCEEKLRESVLYAVFSGGKRVRPSLSFLTAEFCDIADDEVFELAAAIELLHSYSLVHDDLPCMDNDDFRRGNPTVHKKFGEAVAVLTGDALLNLTYEVLFNKCIKMPDCLNSALVIARAGGVDGIIGGQISEFVNAEFDTSLILQIEKKKTSSLIEAAILSVALLSHDNQKISALSEYARNLGLSFQICDDLLDKDKNEKVSLVTSSGESEARNLLSKLTEKAINAIKAFENSDKLIAICTKLAQRTN